jgi:hypothetical protein
LNPFVTDPGKFLYILTAYDDTLVELGYGITYKNSATGAMELECLSTSRCAVKAAAITDYSVECSYNKLGNARSKKGGLKLLHSFC